MPSTPAPASVKLPPRPPTHALSPSPHDPLSRLRCASLMESSSPWLLSQTLGMYGLGGPTQWPTPFDTLRHPITTPAPFLIQARTAGLRRRRHRRSASPVRTRTRHTALARACCTCMCSIEDDAQHTLPTESTVDKRIHPKTLVLILSPRCMQHRAAPRVATVLMMPRCVAAGCGST